MTRDPLALLATRSSLSTEYFPTQSSSTNRTLLPIGLVNLSPIGTPGLLTLASKFETLILDNVSVLFQAHAQNPFFRCLDGSKTPTRTRYHDDRVGETGDEYRPTASSYGVPNHVKEAPRGSFPWDEQFAFKRTLSQLMEINHRREEIWIPLPLTSRKWETNPITRFQFQNNDNSTVEGAFKTANNQHLPKDARLEDWIKGAGEWGSDSRAYESSQPETNDESVEQL
ncbi:hypothetical protein F5051DRAFT_440020 [Lentinula edodes]|nr:hypothetical protein F5051DRAFT_440020 [Lentinula edodes]